MSFKLDEYFDSGKGQNPVILSPDYEGETDVVNQIDPFKTFETDYVCPERMTSLEDIKFEARFRAVEAINGVFSKLEKLKEDLANYSIEESKIDSSAIEKFKRESLEIFIPAIEEFKRSMKNSEITMEMNNDNLMGKLNYEEGDNFSIILMMQSYIKVLDMVRTHILSTKTELEELRDAEEQAQEDIDNIESEVERRMSIFAEDEEEYSAEEIRILLELDEVVDDEYYTETERRILRNSTNLLEKQKAANKERVRNRMIQLVNEIFAMDINNPEELNEILKNCVDFLKTYGMTKSEAQQFLSNNGENDLFDFKLLIDKTAHQQFLKKLAREEKQDSKEDIKETQTTLLNWLRKHSSWGNAAALFLLLTVLGGAGIGGHQLITNGCSSLEKVDEAQDLEKLFEPIEIRDVVFKFDLKSWQEARRKNSNITRNNIQILLRKQLERLEMFVDISKGLEIELKYIQGKEKAGYKIQIFEDNKTEQYTENELKTMDIDFEKIEYSMQISTSLEYLKHPIFFRNLFFLSRLHDGTYVDKGGLEDGIFNYILDTYMFANQPSVSMRDDLNLFYDMFPSLIEDIPFDFSNLFVNPHFNILSLEIRRRIWRDWFKNHPNKDIEFFKKLTELQHQQRSSETIRKKWTRDDFLKLAEEITPGIMDYYDSKKALHKIDKPKKVMYGILDLGGTLKILGFEYKRKNYSSNEFEPSYFFGKLKYRINFSIGSPIEIERDLTSHKWGLFIQEDIEKEIQKYSTRLRPISLDDIESIEIKDEEGKVYPVKIFKTKRDECDDPKKIYMFKNAFDCGLPAIDGCTAVGYLCSGRDQTSIQTIDFCEHEEVPETLECPEGQELVKTYCQKF